MDDKDLRQSVIEELDFDPRVDSREIGVAIKDGVATLTGHVANYPEKLAAERAVWRVKGVRAVAEELEIRLSPSSVTDDDIATRAANVIGWDTIIPDNAVKIKVEHGWLTLSGTVHWQFQREAAASAVRKLTGVRGVTNLVELKPHVAAVDIKSKILAAFKRDAELEANAIQVKVDGSHVSLSGKVKTVFERNAAERAAWSAPGVTAVHDDIHVS
jgi:osmotically-inducible protein OsmY